MNGAGHARARWLAAGLTVCALYAALAVELAASSERSERARVRADSEPAARGPHAADARHASHARRARLDALVSEGGPPLGLGAFLAAVQADTTPAERDPRWSELVERLADALEGKAVSPALDLMVSEQRPRARRALIAAFALLVRSERTARWSADAKQTLIDHFIDGWPALPEAQRGEVEQALRSLAGNDVADVMNGKGLATDDALLGVREREHALQQQSLRVAREEH